MAKKPGFLEDERGLQISGQSALITMGLMQLAMGIIILVRAYVLDQPDEELRDLQLLLAGSYVVFLLIRSFLGGTLRVPSPKKALFSYLAIVAFLFIVLSLIYGLPAPSEWKTTILPITAGPAIVIACYWLIAWLGRRHVERQIRE